MSDKLSDVEKAELAAQAKRTAAPANASAAVAPVVAAPVTTVEPVKPAGLRVTFTPRSGQTKRGARYIADAALLGCFGNAAIVMGGFTLTLDGREIVVYLPGSQYRRDIRPAMIPLERPTQNADGTKTTHEFDLNGVLAISKLEQGIRDAYAAATASGHEFTGEWPLSL